jgi:hypothetical protein
MDLGHCWPNFESTIESTNRLNKRDPIMKRIVILLCGVGVLLCVVLLLRGHDWYASGPAVPPLTNEVLSDIDCRLTSLQLGEQAALASDVEFTWSQYVPINVLADLDTSRWFWRLGGRSFEEKVAHMKHFEHLPTAAFRVSVVRRSSLSQGEAEVCQATFAAERLDESHVKAEGQLWIPQVPGTYRARVFLRTSTRRQDRRMREVKEDLLAVFSMRVLPDTNSR